MGIPGDDHPDVLILIDLGSARRIPSRFGQLGVNAWKGMCRTLLSSAATDLGSRYPVDQRGETYRAFRAVVNYFLRWVSGSVETPSIDDMAEQNDVPTPGIVREAGPLVDHLDPTNPTKQRLAPTSPRSGEAEETRERKLDRVHLECVRRYTCPHRRVSRCRSG